MLVDRGRVHDISATTSSCALVMRGGSSDSVNPARELPCLSRVVYTPAQVDISKHSILGGEMSRRHTKDSHDDLNWWAMWKRGSEAIVGNLQRAAKRPTVIVNTSLASSLPRRVGRTGGGW